MEWIKYKKERIDACAVWRRRKWRR